MASPSSTDTSASGSSTERLMCAAELNTLLALPTKPMPTKCYNGMEDLHDLSERPHFLVDHQPSLDRYVNKDVKNMGALEEKESKKEFLSTEGRIWIPEDLAWDQTPLDESKWTNQEKRLFGDDKK